MDIAHGHRCWSIVVCSSGDGAARTGHSVHVQILAGADEFGHPRVIVVVVPTLLFRPGHAGLNNHKRHNDGQQIDGSKNPHQHVGRIAVGRRDGFGFQSRLDRFRVQTNRGAVFLVNLTGVDNKINVLRDDVARSVRGSHRHPVLSRKEVAAAHHHASGDGFGVAVGITQPREVEPCALGRVSANPAVVVGDSVFKIRDNHIVCSPGEDGDVLPEKVLRAVGVRGR